MKWTNWDQLAVGEDFWDMMEEIHGKQQIVEREQKQMEGIRRRHERRLEMRDLTPPDGKWSDDERANAVIETNFKKQGESKRNKRKSKKQLAVDEAIIRANVLEIQRMRSGNGRGKVALKKIADDFGVSFRVLERILNEAV